MIKSIFAILLCSLILQQETPMKDPEGFKKKFEEISDETTSIQCEFVQKKYLSFSKEPLVSRGKMFYQEQLMRWEQQSPDSYLMVINNDILKIKENGEIREHKLTENKYMKGLKEIMVGSMTGNLLKSDQFDTELLENNEFWVVKLVPKVNRIKKMFNEVKMYFNKSTYRMNTVTMIEPSGDHTDIEFLNPVFNKNIDKSLFELK